MGRPFRVLLGGDKVYSCANCRTHLAQGDDLVSKILIRRCLPTMCAQHFHSKSGRAYLFHTAHNVACGPHESRMMTTGKHVVCDVMCIECRACVGWQYIFAYEESQQYKIGKIILERALVVDFEKTSPAASLARASIASSLGSNVSSGSDASLTAQGLAPASQQQQQQQQQQAARALTGMAPGGGVAYPGQVLFAAEDSGSEDEEA